MGHPEGGDAVWWSEASEVWTATAGVDADKPMVGTALLNANNSKLKRAKAKRQINAYAWTPTTPLVFLICPTLVLPPCHSDVNLQGRVSTSRDSFNVLTPLGNTSVKCTARHPLGARF